MKKRITILLLVSLFCCVAFNSCGSTNESTQGNEVTQEITDEKSTSETTKMTTQKKTEPTTKKEPIPAYMGSVTQQYDDANKQHIFFWQFQDKDKNVIKAAASINVVIKNNDEEVFNKTFEVDEKNFSTWSNKLSSTPKILGSITVNDSEIAEGSETKGVATITATTLLGGFEPMNISVFDLPQKGVSINLPALPAYSNYYSFRGDLDTTMMVSDISYEFDWSQKIKLTAQMTYNSEGEGARDYGHVGYKITDGNGMVVDSGTALFDKLSVGESQIKEVYVSDAKPGDNLTLTIIDAD